MTGSRRNRPRQRWSRGRARLVDAQRTGSSRVLAASTSAGSSATVHRLRAALHGCTTVLYEGKPVGTPDAGASGRASRSMGTPSRRRRRSVRSASRIRSDADRRLRLGRFRRSSSPGSAATSRRSAGPSRSRVPVIDHWWQTDGLGDRRELHRSSGCRSSPARRRRLFPMDAGDDGGEAAPGISVRSS
jgi:acyl-coenzyme A synthetase/AMP-(fatty) acid ligase